MNLIASQYPGQRLLNTDSGGHRLLLVGSTGHRAQEGDILCGVGVKSEEIPAFELPDSITVRGVRGPHTLKALSRAGLNTSDVAFMGDPGLLIGQVFPELQSVALIPGRMSFIPHFRERARYRSSSACQIIDIDAPAEKVGRQIAESEFVCSSSLHGLVWAHALGRPAIAVVGKSGEKAFKYEDYFASLGLAYRPAETLEAALEAAPTARVVDISSVIQGISLPSLAELEDRGAVA
ncbi:polysaccharide pyruvyl transferase family protein [Agromyces salentinus]|uniref:polysaccharide pyruvyl transferase family protein n=1 Tax=Agromyces salentinus TaxID=269421 RepID=UPI0014790D7D|nr:polysaccharide pyruvyl transferase family protein [Agromyces salentinus]